MTSQQEADIALRQRQSLREIDQRIAELVAQFHLPPSETDLEYGLTLRRVSEQMGVG